MPDIQDTGLPESRWTMLMLILVLLIIVMLLDYGGPHIGGNAQPFIRALLLVLLIVVILRLAGVL